MSAPNSNSFYLREAICGVQLGHACTQGTGSWGAYAH